MRPDLRITGTTAGEEFSVPVRALHLNQVQQLTNEAPVDIAFVCVKSYDTGWATTMIAQYLAPAGGRARRGREAASRGRAPGRAGSGPRWGRTW